MKLTPPLPPLHGLHYNYIHIQFTILLLIIDTLLLHTSLENMSFLENHCFGS